MLAVVAVAMVILHYRSTFPQHMTIASGGGGSDVQMTIITSLGIPLTEPPRFESMQLPFVLCNCISYIFANGKLRGRMYPVAYLPSSHHHTKAFRPIILHNILHRTGFDSYSNIIAFVRQNASLKQFELRVGFGSIL